MHYYWWVVGIGFMMGLVARFVISGKRPVNLVLAIVLGVAGAFGGLLAAERFGMAKVGQSAGLVWAGVGAFALLLIYTMLFRGRS